MWGVGKKKNQAERKSKKIVHLSNGVIETKDKPKSRWKTSRRFYFSKLIN